MNTDMTREPAMKYRPELRREKGGTHPSGIEGRRLDFVGLLRCRLDPRLDFCQAVDADFRGRGRDGNSRGGRAVLADRGGVLLRNWLSVFIIRVLSSRGKAGNVRRPYRGFARDAGGTGTRVVVDSRHRRGRCQSGGFWPTRLGWDIMWRGGGEMIY